MESQLLFTSPLRSLTRFWLERRLQRLQVDEKALGLFVDTSHRIKPGSLGGFVLSAHKIESGAGGTTLHRVRDLCIRWE